MSRKIFFREIVNHILGTTHTTRSKGDSKKWFNTLAPGCVHSSQDMIYYFCEKYFLAHKKQATLQKICNFVQIEEESLPQAWGRLLKLLNALPDHPLKKN